MSYKPSVSRERFFADGTTLPPEVRTVVWPTICSVVASFAAATGHEVDGDAREYNRGEASASTIQSTRTSSASPSTTLQDTP